MSLQALIALNTTIVDIRRELGDCNRLPVLAGISAYCAQKIDILVLRLLVGADLVEEEE